VLEKRNSRRSKMVLGVKVSLNDATHLVHTVDISDCGAQLGGLRAQLQPGTIISLQRGRQKANFRIRWIRELATNELRVGLECVQPLNKFWGVDSDKHEAEHGFAKAIMTLITSGSR
jgi:hypothetical protein